MEEKIKESIQVKISKHKQEERYLQGVIIDSLSDPEKEQSAYKSIKIVWVKLRYLKGLQNSVFENDKEAEEYIEKIEQGKFDELNK